MGDLLANLNWHPWSGGFFAISFLLVVFTKPRVAKDRWPSLIVRIAIFGVGMWLAVTLMVQEFNAGGSNTWSAIVSLSSSIAICLLSPAKAQVLRFFATWAMLWALPFLLLPMVADLLPSRFFEGWGFGGILWIPVYLAGAITVMCLNELERVKWGAEDSDTSESQL